MARQVTRQSHQKILGRLARRFDAFRGRNRSRARLPDELRREALVAIDTGVPAILVARAINVSQQQLTTWRRSAALAPPADSSGNAPLSPTSVPRVLSVVSEPSGRVRSELTAQSSARVAVPDGIALDIVFGAVRLRLQVNGQEG